ncbi:MULTISPECIES: sigma-54 dependent transcriptional regulator [unclassified Wenzhouxiangella]|uniref:sigma-54-dependent transcriptional regulator n=1 Tax=unclassified Wenzhouxiangella TaxID=2613841 RepID=UPI000E32B6B3|nr:MULTISPECIES: sigma-54 dependent transcriptional regulator [unclassified Wenzhouxiangella]RFF27157.1 sigma-54-dependent Fis family transcriptional regulator [Wenzhouxiangella sp. 15181]RFP69156.1 sigma-54-dependent Fis family transcriptional regulator [Wenzhouxiangella sp. 15190]
MSSARILIVDDEPDIREMIGEILRDEGHETELAGNAAEARARLRESAPDLILLDVWMPDTDGISLLREWRDAGVLRCPVVMISGHGSVETAVEATRLGAFDFVEKPVSMARLMVTIENALEAGRLKRENEGLKRSQPTVLEPLGRSAVVQQLRQRLERVAQHDAPVLIAGEPGVGKQEAARWIHAHSARSEGPFVSAATRLDGASFRTLLMGERSGEGLLSEAQGGVLFIDDVSRLDRGAQTVLLKVLESGRVDPDQADSSELDLRVIAGTGQPLEKLVREGRFDESLFYQLNVLPLEIPPLRERQEDVPDLIRFYAEFYPGRDGTPYRHFPVAVQNRLRQYHWPGNLRELRNLVQRLLILGGGEEVTVAEVEEAMAQSDTGETVGDRKTPALFNLPLREAREEFERQYLTFKLQSVEGSVGKLAESVEMERTHLYRKLKQLGIDPKQF